MQSLFPPVRYSPTRDLLVSVTLLGLLSLEVDVLMYRYVTHIQAVVEEVVAQRSVNSRHAQLHRMLWFPFPFTFLAHGYNTY